MFNNFFFLKKFYQVLLATSKTCAQLLADKKILPHQINLVIVDECHKSINNSQLKFILQTILSCNNVPRIIGLAVPLFNLTQEPGRLGLEIEKVENTFQCEVETASDILSILRYVHFNIRNNFNIYFFNKIYEFIKK